MTGLASATSGVAHEHPNLRRIRWIDPATGEVRSAWVSELDGMVQKIKELSAELEFDLFR
jgi:hypothetical protein